MSEVTIARTQAEILERISAVKPEDLLGFRQEVLIGALDFEHARPFLLPEVKAEEWVHPHSADVQARDYLSFAIGKIDAHRGLSAGRSVEKLREWAWLFGRDDVVSAMDSAPYENYGAPKVLVFAGGMGWADTWEWAADEGVKRMARGLACSPFGCDEGCGR